MSTTTFEYVPSDILSHIMISYLSLTDLMSLRLVSWRLRVLVDIECVFRVPLTNQSLDWVKTCVPYIQEVILGPLKSSNFLEWPDNLFPEVEELTFNSMVEESNILKTFRVFPSIRELKLCNLTGKEMASVLELRFDQNSVTMCRNKVIDFPLVSTPFWCLITKLEIVMNKMNDSHGEVFGMLSKRTYPNLTSLHLEYRLKGNCNGHSYDQLHVVCILWLQFIGRNFQSINSLTLKHTLGMNMNPQYVPETPLDNLELIDKDSPQYLHLTEKLELMKLREITYRPHFQEEIGNHAWNWNLKLLKFQNSLVHLTFDCSDCWKSRDPEILREILEKSKVTLKSFSYTSTCSKGLQGSLLSVTIDLSMLSECEKLEKLSIGRGWCRRNVEWGPPIIFKNADALPANLKELTLKTDNDKFKTSQAVWISKHLYSLEDLHLSTSMKKAIVTNLMALPRLRSFTLDRDYFSEIKIREMVAFCDSTPGVTYFCPDIHTYDLEGRWLDLLTITVNVNRHVFKLTDEIVKKFSGVFTNGSENLGVTEG